MIIEIDDSLPGKERRDKIIIYQVSYAIDITDNRNKAAEFLGISTKTIQKWCNKYDELHKYIGGKHSFIDNMSEERKKNYFDMLRRYPNKMENEDERINKRYVDIDISTAIDDS